MSEKSCSEKFAQALEQLEQGNNEELLSMFASGARLQRPEQDRQGAEEDAETRNIVAATATPPRR